MIVAAVTARTVAVAISFTCAAIVWRWIARPVVRPIRASAPVVELAERLEHAARLLRGGESLRTSLGQALGDVGPGRAIADGAPLAAELERWATAAPTAHERSAATALLLAALSGGRPAFAVDTAAAHLRASANRQAEVRAQGAQARLSALVIALLPVAFAGCSGAGSRAALRTPTGAASAAAGLLLDALGAWWLVVLARRVR